jgi:hypothetical protein
MIALTLGFFTTRGATVPIDTAALDSVKYSELTDAQISMIKASVRKSPQKVAASTFTGKSYAQWDYTSSKGKCFSAMNEFTSRNDSLFISNFYNYGVEVYCTYDETTSTISIPAQCVYTLAPYGDFYLCYLDIEQLKFSDKIPLQFKVNEDGTMESTSGWAILVTAEGNYKGSALATGYSTKMYQANAKMVGNQRDISAKTFYSSEYPLYVYQEDYQLVAANFSSQGTEIKIYLNADSTVTVEPQAVTYSSYYGATCVYPATWGSTSKGTNENLKGTGTETQITFGPWGVFRASALTTCTFGMEYSTLILNDGIKIKYPSKSDISFTGEGTEASPYLISTDKDLVNLATAVNAGNTYKGKYFKQTATIDCTDINNSFRPIGLTTTECFDGTYDGNGYQIKNIYLERGTSQYTGLFGYAGDNSVIKNVYIYNGYLKSYGKYSGVLVGCSRGKILNDSVVASVYQYADYGGGVSGSASTIDKSYFLGTITTSNANIGGVTGEIYRGKISNSSAQAIITSSVSSASITHAVGGVIGNVVGTKDEPGTAEDCYFMGTIYDTSGYAHLGGVIGTVSSYCVASRCVGLGMMSTKVGSSTTGSCGGVIGTISWGGADNCYAANNIISANDCSKVGGIIGSLLYNSSIGQDTHLSNSLFTGQVFAAGLIKPECSIYGKTDSKSVVTNNYNDAQMIGGDISETSLSTADLTSGKAISGLSTEYWEYKAGRYPIIKGLPENIAEYATSTFFLNEGQSASSVRTSFTISEPENTTWSIYSDSKYVTETNALKINGSTVEVKKILSIQYLAATTTTSGGKFTRLYQLSIAPSQYEGSGTAEDPYLIKTVDDLKLINEGITSFNLTYKGEYFVLANDIDLSGVKDFWGISDNSVETQVFNGIFDGKNHYINNWVADGLTLDDDGKFVAKSSRYTIALFGFIGSNGIVKNLNIGSSCDLRGVSGIAAICAMNEGTIENCRNYGNVSCGQYYAAGIVARNKEGGVVRNCYNAGTITAGSTYAGGIVGQINGASTVEGCQNDGLVHTAQVTSSYAAEGTSVAGGIVGITAEGAKIINCVNNGNVETPKVGGGIVAGLASGASVSGCLNTGIIIVDDLSDNLGAIIGENRATDAYTQNYYDKQIISFGGCDNFDVEGISGLTTAELISGKVLAGLPDSLYDYKAGTYPTLKAFKDEVATAIYRNMSITFAENEAANNFLTTATLNSAEGLTWKVETNSEHFTIEGNILKFANVVSVEYANIRATNQGYTRLFTVMAMYSPFEGDGTEANPFKIKTVEDMKTLSTYTNNYNVRYEGKYFIVTSDLDFTEEKNFTPISWTEGNKFQGDFNGDNHKISNITISWDDKEAELYRYVGIFSTLGELGSIRNLTIESGTISCYTYAGGLVGSCYGTIDNCVNKATIKTTGTTNAAGLVAYLSGGKVTNSVNEGNISTATTHAGGLVSYASTGSVIENCTNRGNVSAADGKNCVGGIVTYGGARIVNCVNEGTLTATSGLGGIAYQVSNATDSVINCVNRGKFVTTTGATCAGIVGSATTTVKNCYNYSDITTAGSYLGGIVGNLTGTIDGCDNYGKLAAGKTYAGGIAGYAAAGSVIKNSNNYAETITNTSYYTAGIVGYIIGAASEIRDCVNYANITGTTANSYGYGGIAGNCVGKIYDCINYGDISTEGYSTAGIAGQGSGYVYNSINFGDIKTTYNVSTKTYGNAGGIWGHASGVIDDCINYGNVSAVRYAGGILGYTSASSKLHRNYFAGALTSTDSLTTGAICHKLATQTKVVVDSCYYNSDLNRELKQSETGAAVSIAKTTLELRTAALGNAFDYHDYSLPTLKSFSKLAEANAAAALVVFAENESADNFVTNANVDLLEGLEWSVTSNIKLDGNVLTAQSPTKNAEGTITVVGGKITREFKVILNNEASGIDNTYLNKEVLSTQYFTIQGYEIDEPIYNVVLIKRITYTDGTVSTQKVVLQK